MTAEEILEQIRGLSPSEQQLLTRRMRELAPDEIPQDFIEALEDFRNGRFVSMEAALKEAPPGQ